MNRYEWFNLATAPASQFDFWLEIKDYNMVNYVLEKAREYILTGLER